MWLIHIPLQSISSKILTRDTLWMAHGPLARYVKLRVAHARVFWERFPSHRGLAILTCITARASRTCRDACRDSSLAVSLEVGVWQNIPGIPGACASHNFTNLVRGHVRVIWRADCISKITSMSCLFHCGVSYSIQPCWASPERHYTMITGFGVGLLILIIYAKYMICWQIGKGHIYVCSVHSCTQLW